MRTTLRLAIVLAVLGAAQFALAKRPLTFKDFDSWQSILSQQLTRDGKLLAYALMLQEGDGEFVLRNLATGQEFRAPIGMRPRTRESDDEEPATPAARFAPLGPRIAFSADGKWVVCGFYPSKAEVEKARAEKKKPEEMPKNGIVIMETAGGNLTRIEKVKSFQLPEEGGPVLVYHKEGAPAAEVKKEEEEKKDQARRRPGSAAPGAAGASGRKQYGSELVIRNLPDSSERTLIDVLDYSLAKDGKTLAYTVSSRSEATEGVYSVVPGQSGEPQTLLAGKGKYLKLTWDENQTRLAFFSDRDDASSKQPQFKIYFWDRQAAAARELVAKSTPGFRAEFAVSDKGSLRFSRDGKRLFLPASPPPEPEQQTDTTDAEDKVVADLWHWKDDNVQPMQKVRAERERNRTYNAVWHFDESKLVQLADATLRDVNPPEDGRWAIGGDDRAYRPMVEYDASYSDYYIVDTLSGSRTLAARKARGGLNLSPDGRFATHFDGKDWISVSIPDGRATNLTAKLGVNFWEEDHDAPGAPASYGTGGWTNDSKYALLYDEFDIWQVAPDGSAAKNLTDGAGRKAKIRFRYTRTSTDPSDRGIDPKEPLLLRAEHQETRDSGFYRDRVDGAAAPERLIWGSRNYSFTAKAKNADVYLISASRFDEYPDLLVTDSAFRNPRQVTDANPQRSDLLWGSAEQFRFRNSDGMALWATLIKPENFDPAKKYPMIVYIYEKLSQGLHRFVDPAPSHSINASLYASNGYLVLFPDIHYTIGYPGQSALKCVLPAIQAVADRGFLDEKAIGIQGHSWGGYQIAYMVTRTNRFRAAAAGAPVANMISAYDGIRWGTGLPRQFQYERTQSRIGGSLWQHPMRFIENSPIFTADRVETPLLMLHNDNDDAVPWYQGIEYFLALRRLGKEVYLFNYNGEPHGLRKRANQKDYAMRTFQFFEHHLRGAPKPEWMERGIPYLEREKEKLRFHGGQ